MDMTKQAFQKQQPKGNWKRAQFTEEQKAQLQIEALQLKLKYTENQAMEEKKEKEREMERRAEIQKKVQELEWHFKPYQEQTKARDFQTPAFLLLQKQKKELIEGGEDDVIITAK